VEADEVFLGGTGQAQGIGLAQVVLGDEGEILHVGEMTDVFRLHLSQMGGVAGVVGLYVGDGRAQSLELQFLQLFPG